MSLATVATVFCVIALAELPDKTMIATVVMGSRGEPLWVWLGAACAFLLHVAIAVVAGQLLSHLPHTAIEVAVAILFFAGAAYLLLVPEKVVEDTADAEVVTSSKRRRGVALTAFGVILIGEFGDLTQLLTASFVARTHEPASVAVGAAAALLSVSAIAAFSGRALIRVLPLEAIRRAGGVLLLGFASYSVYLLATG